MTKLCFESVVKNLKKRFGIINKRPLDFYQYIESMSVIHFENGLLRFHRSRCQTPLNQLWVPSWKKYLIQQSTWIICKRCDPWAKAVFFVWNAVKRIHLPTQIISQFKLNVWFPVSMVSGAFAPSTSVFSLRTGRRPNWPLQFIEMPVKNP